MPHSNHPDTTSEAAAFQDSNAPDSGQQLRLLFRAVEQSANVVLVTDTDGNIEYVNPKLLSLTGYAREEVIGQTPRIFRSPNTPAEVHERLWATLKAEEIWRGASASWRRTTRACEALTG